MRQKRWLALLLTLVMAFSVICPLSALAAGNGDEIANGLTGGNYTDESADADTAYTYTVVGSDGSEATAEVMAVGDATETLTTTPAISWERTEDTKTTSYRCSTCGSQGTESGYHWCSTCSWVRNFSTVTTGNYVSDIAYVNSNGSYTSGGVTYPQYTALNWNWSSLNKLINNEDTRVKDVWSQQTDKMYACKFSQNGNGGSNWDKASVYKISGTFDWPEDYDLNETTITIQSKNDSSYSEIYNYINNNGLSDLFGDGKVIAVNDDVYVVMWVEDSNGAGAPTAETMNDYLLFWTGSSGKGFWTHKGNTDADWNRQTPATFVSAGKQGVRAFHEAWPNAVGVTAGLNNTNVVNQEFSYLTHTDGWYTLTDTSAINSVMRNNYGATGIQPGATVHLDLYCFNNDGEGMIDELVVNLATQRETETSVTVNYYYGNVTTPDDTAHFLGSSVLTNQAYGTSISLPAGTNASQLDYMRAAAIIKAGKQDVSSGTQVNDPLIVTRGADNVINVLYTAKDAKIITLTSNSQELSFDGNSHTIDALTVISGAAGEQQQAATKQDNGTWKLPDGNYLQAVTVGATGTYCGKYPNSIEPGETGFAVKDGSGNDVTNSYTIVKKEGTLTITPVTDFVIDYGLPLDITPSDMGFAPTGSTTFTLGNTPLQYGDVVLSNSNQTLAYTPNKTVDGVESIPVSGLAGAGGYTYNGSINIIPATNVLYEESFASTSNDQAVKWTKEGTAAQRQQQTAYPGMTGSKVYGYDDAYAADSAYSNGSAWKANLTARCQGRYYTTDSPKATFTFTGTGFDLYSECGANTGALFVTVADANGAIKKGYMVDTYFNGVFTKSDDTIISVQDGMTYQIPVVHDERDAYGTYTVTVYGYWVNNRAEGATAMATSAESFEESLRKELGFENIPFEFLSASGADTFVADTEGASVFGVYDEESTQTAYIDGFRVYNPLGTENLPTAYTRDNENEPRYISLFDFLKTDAWNEAIVYIEKSEDGSYNQADYQIGSGPYNEIYLAPNSSISFTSDAERVMVSVKTINGDTTMNNVTITSGTEQYFELNGTNGTYTIINNGGHILSLVNLKLIDGALATVEAEAYTSIATALGAPVTLQDGTVVEPEQTEPDPVEPEWVNPYDDVHQQDWFYEYVKYVTQHGLMNGMGDGKFAPKTVMNRAMLATVLYRIAGEPEVSGEKPFSDVATGEWYSDAILWAAQKGVVEGVGGGKFLPNDPLTREQMVTMLYRYWKLSNPDAAATDETGEQFKDWNLVSDWALEAMRWAVANGQINGMTAETLSPQGSLPREQAATLLARYDQLVSDK
ncbi:MAG: S-layer homology domain-containing protein [Oscillospiraceae bacterium]|nr:S-layer homology domain-containing protein [Oscillospiraceae bacterium]